MDCWNTSTKTSLTITSVLLLWVAFLSPIKSFSQATEGGNISGKINDQNDEPLPYTQVRLEGTPHKTMTDLEGNFLFENIKAGTYTIKTTLIGFKTHKKEVKVENNKTTVSHVSMKENVKELNEVVVEAPKTEAEEIRESGFSVDVIEMEEAEKQSIQTNEVLDQEAGVRIRQEGGLGSRVNYNLNGLSGSSVRIFLDGIPIENYGASFSINSIPTSMIERIEVYKGVVPAEFGTDALGGAINIVTKKNAPNTLNTSYSYGSFNTHQWSLNGNFRDSLSGFTVKGSAYYNYSDNNYKVWGDQVYTTNPETGKITYNKHERFHDTYQSGGIKLDAGFTNVKWADQFFVGVLRSGMKQDIQHGATMESVYGNRWMNQNTLLFNTSYIKKDVLTKGLDVNLFASYSDLTRNVIDTIPYQFDWDGSIVTGYDGEPKQTLDGAEAGAKSLNEAQELNYVFRGNINYEINEHHAFNINQLSDNFSRKPFDPLWTDAQKNLTDTRYLSKNVTGITYKNSAFKGKLKTTVFYKYYYQNMRLKDPERIGRTNEFTAVEYDETTEYNGYGIAMGYNLLPELQITGSAEKAIRLPTGTEVFGNTASAIESSYSLVPEQSNNFNLGFNLGAIRWKKHKFYWKFNVFYRDVNDKIQRAMNHDLDETSSFVNFSKILSKGFDTEVKYVYNNHFNWITGVSVFNARNNKQYDEHGDEFIYYGDRLKNAPYFTLNTNLRYNTFDFLQKDSRASFYYNIGYVHEFYREWESLGGAGKNIIPTQLVHSLGLSYTFPTNHITLSFDIKNITNEQVFDNWALQKPGRACYFKISYTIL